MSDDAFAAHARTNRVIYEFAKGYLDKHGWMSSMDVFVKNNDEYVPWITYPAQLQLDRIAKPEWRVFEFGCGGSSLWWAKRVKEVVSVEHDPKWARLTEGYAPANLKILTRPFEAECPPARREAVEKFLSYRPFLPLSPEHDHNMMHGLVTEGFEAYATEITEFAPESFDVIVVDGMARTLCSWLAAPYLKPNGILVFDNSDRWQYNTGFRILSRLGFKRIDFYGPGPVHAIQWCTSIFARDLEAFSSNVDRSDGEGDLGW